MSVAPALHVLVGIVGACWLAALEICVVEDFLGVCGWEARDDYVAIAIGLVFFVCHDSFRFEFPLVQETEGGISHQSLGRGFEDERSDC